METILQLIRHAMISDGPHSDLFPFSRADNTKISVCSSQETAIPDSIHRALYEISVFGFQFWLCHLIAMWLDKWFYAFLPLQNKESQLNHLAEKIRDMIKGDSMYKSTLTNSTWVHWSFVMRACFNWFYCYLGIVRPIDQDITAVEKKSSWLCSQIPREGVHVTP